jgi:transketolase
VRDRFATTLHAVAKVKHGVFIVVADISPAGSMAPFRADFPERFVNVGVAEQTMMGMCAGLALRGCRPFAYTIATFAIYRPFEQVRIDVCYQNLPVTIVGIGAGVAYSTLGGTHHAMEDVAVMSALPNMSIIAPCDPVEVEAATWACASHDGPVYLRLGKAGEPELTGDAAEPFTFGKVRLLQKGADVCIIAYGPIMKMGFDLAARVTEKTGVRPAVVSAHTLKPLDTEGLAALLHRFATVVVLEEHSAYGGLGPQVKQIAWDSGARCKLHTFSLQDNFIHVFGSQKELWEAHGLTLDKACAAIGV